MIQIETEADELAANLPVSGARTYEDARKIVFRIMGPPAEVG